MSKEHLSANKAAVKERARMGRNRHPAGEGTRALSPEENLQVQEARDHVLASQDPDVVVLWNHHFPFWRYGPGIGSTPGTITPDLIVFGPEPHVAKVPLDHPLLFGMLKADPTIEVVLDADPGWPVEPDTQTEPEPEDRYIDPFTGMEFGSMNALAQHMRETYDITPPKIRRAAARVARAAQEDDDMDEPTTKTPPEVPDETEDEDETTTEEPKPEDK